MAGTEHTDLPVLFHIDSQELIEAHEVVKMGVRYKYGGYAL
jgi:hypothetical protein